MFGKGTSEKVRKPAVAGLFYPRGADELQSQIDALMAGVSQAAPPIPRPLGLISPHAGLPYSGHVAVQAYSRLRHFDYRRVAVVSPSHVDSFAGASVFDGHIYETPLGKIRVDRESCQRLAESTSEIFCSDRGHGQHFGRGEHALEVQLPFLQRALENFQLIPIVLGEQSWATCRTLARRLANILDPETDLIVASSDLSHFYSYSEAVRRDHRVVQAIERYDYWSLFQNLRSRDWEACGGGPIVAVMLAADLMGADCAKILRYANSGDVEYGDRDRVVGYLSAALLKSREGKDSLEEFDERERQTLLNIAYQAVRDAVLHQENVPFLPDGFPRLSEERAVFVTIKKAGTLRGCVGSVVATDPLFEAVASAAVNAARNDFRFSPIDESELDQLSVSITVLGPFHLLSSTGKVEIGRHGILVEQGAQRGLLLPQVAVEQGWDTDTLLAYTCRKAGLSDHAWKSSETDVFFFRGSVIRD